MNKIFSVGNLTADARTLTVGQQEAVQFNVGVRTSTKDKDGNGYISNFLSVIVFGNLGKLCAQLKKGDRVAVSGDLCAVPYMTRDGRAGVNINVRADSVDFMTPKSQQQSGYTQPQAARQAPTIDPDDELPF